MSAARVYTARWHLVREVSRGTIVPVRISLFVARFIPGARGLPAIDELTPTRELFGIQDAAEFRRRYRAKLDGHGVKLIQSRFNGLHACNPGLPLVLLCFEEDRRDCHRGDFAEWWEEKTGVAVPEYTTASAVRLADQEHPVIQRFQAAATRARRVGTCHLCADLIAHGDLIVKLGRRGSWVHLACANRGVQDMCEAHE